MPRPLITTIFIACEGTNTEPIYFERINEIIEDEGKFELTVYPDKRKKEDENPRTDAIGLVKEAHSRADSFDELWAVFDKDGYTLHETAFALAAEESDGKSVRTGFSSIAFEQWVLLHFERSDFAFAKSQDIINRLIGQNYFPDYEKKADADVYSPLQNLTKVAICNAGWLRMRKRQQGLLPGTPVYELNPITTIDVLIKRLFEIIEDIEWNWINNPYKIQGIIYTLNWEASNLYLQIENTTNASLIFNYLNIENQFQLLRNDVEPIPLTIQETIIITPGNTRVLILHAAQGALINDVFIITAGSLKVFSELQ